MSTLAMFPSELVALADNTDAQCTPRELALELGSFGTDPCSNPRSHIAADVAYMLERGEDGLSLPWLGSVWCNGAYSDPLPWCERLRAYGEPWAALWKLDTTTEWWRVLAASGASWAPFRERLTFERAGNCGTANFSSALWWHNGWKPSRALSRRLWAARKESGR